MYTEELMRVPETALARANTKIVLVGQGEWKVIQAFRDLTGFTGPIYAHPSQKLHSLFKFVETMALAPAGQKPKYMKQLTHWGNFMRGWAETQGVFRFPSLLFSAGPPTLNGGDLVLGPGNQCAFFHRMQNTQDHVEVVDLMRHAGVMYTPT
ncbi:hypothetical protein MKEN_00289500 [Mycena kentingensis (nom. inval.)]|nr:hypothetical protein MKEN_00289500 [Mycena kentingensis (nom. inval.)]